MRIFCFFTLMLALVVLMLGCGSQQNSPTPLPPASPIATTGLLTTTSPSIATNLITTTPSPLPTLTPQPTNTPFPTNTPRPTNTPLPTDTPRPTNTPIPSPTPVNFTEEFDTLNINETVWENVGPPLELTDGYVSLKSTLGIFPYVYGKQNLFPTQGNFTLEFSFRYPTVTDRGVGFVIGETVPPYGSNPNSESFFSVWQDSRHPLNIRFMGTDIFTFAGNDILQHTVNLIYDGKYDILVDGTVVYSSPPIDVRPTALWFGNPVNVGANGAWSSLEIHYIRIYSNP